MLNGINTLLVVNLPLIPHFNHSSRPLSFFLSELSLKDGKYKHLE